MSLFSSRRSSRIRTPVSSSAVINLAQVVAVRIGWHHLPPFPITFSKLSHVMLPTLRNIIQLLSSALFLVVVVLSPFPASATPITSRDLPAFSEAPSPKSSHMDHKAIFGIVFVLVLFLLIEVAYARVGSRAPFTRFIEVSNSMQRLSSLRVFKFIEKAADAYVDAGPSTLPTHGGSGGTGNFSTTSHSTQGLISVAQRNFQPLQDISADDVALVATIPGYPDTEPVEIAPELWSTVSHVVDMVTIVLESGMLVFQATICEGPGPYQKCRAPIPQPSTRQYHPTKPPRELCRSIPSSSLQLSFRSTLRVNLGFKGLAALFNIKFLPNTSSAPPSLTIKEPGLLEKVSYLFGLIETRIGYSATISELLFGFRGKKPVTYLYPPSSLADITVELALASSWRFSAVHPPPQTTIPPGQPHTAQCVTWTVAAEPNGTLVDKLKHEYIALRFIAQEPYKKAAAMRITPAPDIVTRVFMLFRRVAAGDLALSEPARARTAEGDGATFWVDEVGVDAARAADSGWFRVLE
ncbi:hypothetical protein EDB87DRAFT_1728898 [Lactarius vividus]|nr:hypothetical protein EDB87DRAFT_1728898 [Lactarius vividus]